MQKDKSAGLAFEALAEDLAAAAGKVQGVASKNQLIPIWSHLLLTGGADGLFFSATDGEVVVRCLVGAKGVPTVSSHGSVAIPSKKGVEVFRVLPKGAVAVSVDDGNRTTIRAGKGRFVLAGLSGNDFPELPARPAEGSFEIDALVLSKMVGQVLPAVSTDASRYGMAGAYVENVETERGRLLRMTGTDGHRLAISDGDVPGTEKIIGPKGVLVPRKGLLELARLTEEGVSPVEAAMTDKYLYAKRGDTEVWIRLLDAEFPNYRQIVPKEDGEIARVSREAIVEAIKRVGTMAPDKIHTVVLEFGGDSIAVSATDPEFGEAKDSVPCVFPGSARVGFNLKYLLDSLDAIADGSVMIGIRDPFSAVVIRGDEDRGFLALVMPMRA